MRENRMRDDCARERERLSAFVDGELPPADARVVQQHLDACAACTRALEELRAVDGWVRDEAIAGGTAARAHGSAPGSESGSASESAHDARARDAATDRGAASGDAAAMQR